MPPDPDATGLPSALTVRHLTPSMCPESDCLTTTALSVPHTRAPIGTASDNHLPVTAVINMQLISRVVLDTITVHVHLFHVQHMGSIAKRTQDSCQRLSFIPICANCNASIPIPSLLRKCPCNHDTLLNTLDAHGAVTGSRNHPSSVRTGNDSSHCNQVTIHGLRTVTCPDVPLQCPTCICIDDVVVDGLFAQAIR